MLYQIYPLFYFNWRSLHDFKGKYFINNNGFLLSLNKKSIKILKNRIDRAGYYTVRLSNEGKSHTQYVHRLVAKAFLPNHQSLKFVNHRNGVKTDNNIRNLEWVSHSSNIKHAYDLGLIKKTNKPVIDICRGKKFNSSKEAAQFHNIKYSTLRNYLNGQMKIKSCFQYL
jgi:hypothetical protein